MSVTQTATASGLDGVLVAETLLSEVDGEKGRLIIGGHDVETLALNAVFEDVCALLWKGGKLPTDAERESMRKELAAARKAAFDRIAKIGDALDHEDGMDALRASVAHLSATDKDQTADFVRLTAAVAVFAAAWCRKAAGCAPIAPDLTLSHAADYYRMATGKAVDAARVRALDTYLVTVSDHGMNASTFTARVVASTASDSASSVTAAIGALKGPLHGGAPGPVLDMLDAIGKPENASKWLEAEVDAKRRIMGMGHRIYKVRDPRAAVLEKAIERMEKAGVKTDRLALARAVEKAAEEILRRKKPDHSLHANVEFYTAVVLDAAGLPRTLFSPTFGVGRVVGWCAHIAEHRAVGRLIRPASKYVGPMPS
jgi:citrate synthase